MPMYWTGWREQQWETDEKKYSPLTNRLHFVILICLRLFSQTKLLDKCTILVDVVLLEIFKKTTSLTYHLEQTAS